MSAQKNNMNTDKSVNKSNNQSSNNYASPANIFHRDNTNKSAQGPTINKHFITPLRVVNDESKINTTQNVTTEKVTTGNKSNEENVTTSKEH